MRSHLPEEAGDGYYQHGGKDLREKRHGKCWQLGISSTEDVFGGLVAERAQEEVSLSFSYSKWVTPSTCQITKAHNDLSILFLRGRPTNLERSDAVQKRYRKCEPGHVDDDACQPRAKLISKNNSDMTLHVTTLLESIPAWRKTLHQLHAGTTSWFRGLEFHYICLRTGSAVLANL